MPSWLVNAIGVFSGAAWQHLVLALLHTLWQAVAAAVALWTVLRWVPARRGNVRYAAALAALGCVVIAGVVTWAVLDHPPSASYPQTYSVPIPEAKPPPAVATATPATPAIPGAGAAAARTVEPPSRDQPIWIQWIGAAWLAGLFIMLIRLAASLWSVNQLRRDSRLLNNGRVCELLDDMRRALAVARRVRIAASDRIRVPVVVGVLWPLVLVPVSALTEVPAEQLKLVLAHELAHVRRWDYLVNLLQMLVEAVLFFNPAVWWISRQVRVERESCCDALAVAATGERIGYAAALVAWAEQWSGPPPLTTPAFVPPNRAGALLNRVVRIVSPESRPRVHVPWYSSVVVVMLSLVVLAALRGGAVLAVEKLMTPRERIEKLVEVEHVYGGKRLGEEGQKITVSGVIRTAAGEPLPYPVRVDVNSQSNTSSYGLSGASPDAQGHFSYREIPRGTIYILARAAGYTPVLLGPLEADADGQLKDLKIVLEHGSTGVISLVDQKGNPITGASVNAAIMFARNRSDSIGKWTSDAHGMVAIEHCSPLPLRFEVSAPGYQYEVLNTPLKEKQPIVWRLTPAAPATGIVVFAKDGSAIPGARIELISRRGYEDTNFSPNSQWPDNLLAISADDGRFTLTTLRDGVAYRLRVSAENHSVEVVEAVFAGEKDITVKLGSPRVIRGKVLGDVNLLSDRAWDQGHFVRALRYTATTRSDGSNFSEGTTTPLTIRDDTAMFEIKDLPPCEVEFNVPAPAVAPTKIDMTEAKAVEGVVIDLRPPSAGGPAPAPVKMRSVILQLRVPPGHPAPRGKLRVYNPIMGSSLDALSVDDKGRAECSVPVKSRLHVETDDLIGYWIKEDWLDVPDDAGSLTINLDAHPSGAMYGRVLNPDGKPCPAYSVSVQTMERSPEVSWQGMNLQPVNGGQPDGRFAYTPLALGGKYRLIVSTYQVGSRAIAVSDPVRLDANQPMHEVLLRLASGVDVAGEVRDPAGRPVVGANVQLDFSIKSRDEASGVSGISQQSDLHGRFCFTNVNPDLPGEYKLMVLPTHGFRGTGNKIKPDGAEMIVTLQPGPGVKGTVIDDATGRPVPNARVSARPLHLENLTYWGGLETRSDSAGNFSLAGLEDMSYRIEIDGAYPPGAVVTHGPGGTTSVSYPNGYNWPDITAGQSGPVQIRVTLDPQSSLKPLP